MELGQVSWLACAVSNTNLGLQLCQSEAISHITQQQPKRATLNCATKIDGIYLSNMCRGTCLRSGISARSWPCPQSNLPPALSTTCLLPAPFPHSPSPLTPLNLPHSPNRPLPSQGPMLAWGGLYNSLHQPIQWDGAEGET